MSNVESLPYSATLYVRDHCLCLHAQRAARVLARRFDIALKPVGLTNGQYSLMMSLNRPEPPTMNQVAAVLAMDRTTLTAGLKPLKQRGLVSVRVDKDDKRSRRLVLTATGKRTLARAYPIWEATHAGIERALADADRFRADLKAVL